MDLVYNNTGTAGGPGGRDRMLAMKSRKNAKKSVCFFRNFFFFHISSSYAKILGETNFQTSKFPRSGSKAKDGEKKKERKKSENW